MTSIADRALVLRIKNRDNNPDVLIDAVLRTPEVSERVLEALDQRIANAHMAWRELLPYFQRHSRPKLFSALYERMTPHEFDAAELFGMGYGGPTLEEVLCQKLYDTYNGKGLELYGHLLKALSKRGGPRSLEMMEVINHELYPVIKTNRIVADTICEGFSEEKGLSVGEVEQLIKSKVLGDFSPALKAAINQLHQRGIQLPEDLPNADLGSGKQLSGRVLRVEHFMGKAKELLPDYPPESLNNMRKATEAICKDVLDAAFLSSQSPNRKPAAAFNSLEDMINRMRKEALIPSSVEKCLASLQSFGNFASHDQEEDPQSVSVEMAESTFGHLKTVVDWYASLNLQIEQKSE